MACKFVKAKTIFFRKIFTYLALDNILGHENWLELVKMPIKIT